MRRLQVLASVAVAALAMSTQSVARTHTIIVSGLGGETLYEERFEGWARGFRDAARARFGGGPETVKWLAASAAEDADGPARREAVLSALDEAIASADAGHLIVLALIGHGTARGPDVAFNLPGPDLRPGDLAARFDALGDRTVVFINTSSASGPFVEALARRGRIIVTATANAAELHVARFGGFFVEALVEAGADADKDGRLSVLEAFEYARLQVERSFTKDKLLKTEHALLDDDGDGVGTMLPASSDSDGRLARTVYLVDVDAPAADARALAIQVAARRLVADIESLRRKKAILREAEYFGLLEGLLVELALNRRELREGAK